MSFRRTVFALSILFLIANFSAGAQRLPAGVRPEHYKLTLTPDLHAATFSGEETIDVILDTPSKKITLNAAELKFVSVQETHLYERVARGVVGSALPRALSKTYTLNVSECEPFHFDANALREHVILAGMIKKETDRRSIPWEIVEEYQ